MTSENCAAQAHRMMYEANLAHRVPMAWLASYRWYMRLRAEAEPYVWYTTGGYQLMGLPFKIAPDSADWVCLISK